MPVIVLGYLWLRIHVTILLAQWKQKLFGCTRFFWCIAAFA